MKEVIDMKNILFWIVKIFLGLSVFYTGIRAIMNLWFDPTYIVTPIVIFLIYRWVDKKHKEFLKKPVKSTKTRKR
jgi:hypothetical protein